ncbi:MAG: hypothetical protein MUC63_07745 [Planctomycetes bacterium]|nr:hypothetical protein [Planctomycetota bacterium]
MDEAASYPQDTPDREEDLLREGWARRFLADEPRLSECVALYESLGFEVRLRRLGGRDLEGPECAACLKADPGRFRILYTRARA